MPLDYPPELVCTAYCNNPDCNAEIGILCQYGDDKSNVEEKLKGCGWFVRGEEVFCSARCRARCAANPVVAARV